MDSVLTFPRQADSCRDLSADASKTSRPSGPQSTGASEGVRVGKKYFVYNNNSDMRGPFTLTELGLAGSGLEEGTPGVYLLLAKAQSGKLIVCYVGRSDDDLYARLQDHVADGEYVAFYYRECDDEDDAYFSECEEFHRYGKVPHLDNEVHPDRPNFRKDLPVCSELGCRGESA